MTCCAADTASYSSPCLTSGDTLSTWQNHCINSTHLPERGATVTSGGTGTSQHTDYDRALCTQHRIQQWVLPWRRTERMTNSCGPQRRPIRCRARDWYRFWRRTEHVDGRTLRILNQQMWAHILCGRQRQAGLCSDKQTTCRMLPAGGIFAKDELDFLKVENTLFQHVGSRVPPAGALVAPTPPAASRDEQRSSDGTPRHG